MNINKDYVKGTLHHFNMRMLLQMMFRGKSEVSYFKGQNKNAFVHKSVLTTLLTSIFFHVSEII